MNKNLKWLLVSVVALSVVTVGVYCEKYLVTYAKEKRLQNLIEMENKERAILESMTGSTAETLKQQVEQGQKVKQLGIEVGKLREELYPTSPRDQLMHDIAGQKLHFQEKLHGYKYMANDAAQGKIYQKAWDILLVKIQTLERIEHDFNVDNKSIRELQQEFDNLMKVPEFD